MLDIMEIQNSTIVNGKGVFVQMHHKKGDIVFVLSGRIYDEPTRETIHIGNNKHIYDAFGIFINHSFEPNIQIQGLNVVALCDIQPGDEIMFNYNDTEINMANPFCVNETMVFGKRSK